MQPLLLIVYPVPLSLGHYLEAFHEASNRVKNILCVTILSRLSTGYDMARVAKEQAETELPQTSIAVLDSQTVTAAEGFGASAGAQTAADGKDLTEVVQTFFFSSLTKRSSNTQSAAINAEDNQANS
jgi:fatty acid-binding protein DegV